MIDRGSQQIGDDHRANPRKDHHAKGAAVQEPADPPNVGQAEETHNEGDVHRDAPVPTGAGPEQNVEPRGLPEEAGAPELSDRRHKRQDQRERQDKLDADILEHCLRGSSPAHGHLTALQDCRW
jgi:hypothetical protein